MPKQTLICPVPVAHIGSALALADQGDGRVAFGSGSLDGGGQMWEFFTGVSTGTPVLIYVSPTGKNVQNCAEFLGPVLSLQATFVSCETDPQQVAAIRPDSTKTDGTWQVFWICKCLQRIPERKQISLNSIGLQTIPRRPMLRAVRALES